MNYQLAIQIIILIVYIVTLILFVKSYYKVQQALQWWSCRQSLKLFLEAEKIRDDLLQESFTIRRNLELLPVESRELSTNKTQEFLKKIDNFHQSLAQLSDRLFPVYLQDSLPFAIQSLLEPWLVSHSHIYFQIELPSAWRHEPAERSLVILRALEELLKITLSEALTQTSIYIRLEQKANLGNLLVKITYPDLATLAFYTHLPELDYLCESFKFLTSGKCVCHSKNLSLNCNFSW
ncbi:MAG: hypothetical protein IGS49_02935 [Chlorogloeopsis fritschii C42_A2020_084]|uniref:hypothetical protein n=1 Tax=Chlorogloeopsis fritschii TaxID=1124 RepID=UPI0019DA83F9|nr:hypothetical protein [Chlorogloeopsis fritschii]MBF2004442.1 hypothetical protein [Chlorogloeopsis fritschii C42_A2020_084]